MYRRWSTARRLNPWERFYNTRPRNEKTKKKITWLILFVSSLRGNMCAALSLCLFCGSSTTTLARIWLVYHKKTREQFTISLWDISRGPGQCVLLTRFLFLMRTSYFFTPQCLRQKSRLANWIHEMYRERQVKVFLRHLHPFVRTLRVLEVSRKQHPPQKASCIFCVCFFFSAIFSLSLESFGLFCKRRWVRVRFKRTNSRPAAAPEYFFSSPFFLYLLFHRVSPLSSSSYVGVGHLLKGNRKSFSVFFKYWWSRHAFFGYSRRFGTYRPAQTDIIPFIISLAQNRRVRLMENSFAFQFELMVIIPKNRLNTPDELDADSRETCRHPTLFAVKWSDKVCCGRGRGGEQKFYLFSISKGQPDVA